MSLEMPVKKGQKDSVVGKMLESNKKSDKIKCAYDLPEDVAKAVGYAATEQGKKKYEIVQDALEKQLKNELEHVRNWRK